MIAKRECDMFGLTKNEQRVLLFLTTALLAGCLVNAVEKHVQSLPPVSGEPMFKEIADTADGPVAVEAEKSAGSLSGKVSLNSASAAELERIPGIGPVTAERILSYRQKRGPFRSVDELLSVEGIGPKKLQKIRPYVQLH